jgi:hypothetical protein
MFVVFALFSPYGQNILDLLILICYLLFGLVILGGVSHLAPNVRKGASEPAVTYLTRKQYRSLRGATTLDQDQAWLRHRLRVRKWKTLALSCFEQSALLTITAHFSGGATVSSPTKAAHDELRDLIHADAAHQATAGDVIAADQAAKIIAPFAYSEAAKDYLAHLGIATPLVGTRTHQHPIHRTIENYILAKCLPAYGSDATLIVWMKDWKARALGTNITLANPTLTVRDSLRYGKAFSSALPPDSGFKHAFLHDAAHFLPPSFITALFKAYPKLEDITYTIVIPAELLIQASSFAPGVYSYTVLGSKFLYEIERHPEDHYEQELDCVKWLLIRSIDGHSVERLQSLGAHHVYRCTRATALASKQYDSFPVPDAVVLPDDSLKTIPLAHRLVDREVYRKVCSNARVVKGAYSIHSAAAKTAITLKSGLDGSTEWMHPMAEQHMEAYALAHRELRATRYFFKLFSPFQHGVLVACLAVHTRLRRVRHLMLALFVVLPLAVVALACYRHDLTWPWIKAHTIGFQPAVLCDLDQVPTLYGSRRLAALARDSRTYELTCSGLRTELSWWSLPTRFLGDGWTAFVASLRVDVSSRWRWTQVNSLNLLVGLLPAARDRYFPVARPSLLRRACWSALLYREVLSVVWHTYKYASSREVYMRHVKNHFAEPFRLTVELQDISSSFFSDFHLDLTAETVKLKLITIAAPSEPTAELFVPAAETDDADELPTSVASDCDIELTTGSHRPYPAAMTCLFDALGSLLDESPRALHSLLTSVTDAEDDAAPSGPWSTRHLDVLCKVLGISVVVNSDAASARYGVGPLRGSINHTSAGVGHFSHVKHVPTPQQPTPDTHRPVTNGSALSIKQIVDLLLLAQYKGCALAFATAKTYDITVKSARDKLNPSKRMTRFKYLASDYKNKFTGIIMSDQKVMAADFAKRMDAIADTCVRAPVQLISIMGYNGCGKTAPLTAFLKANPSIMRQCKVATPENKLAAQWTSDLGLLDQDSFRVGSYESTCFKKTARILIVDEVGKMKNGYVDLCILMDPAIELVIVLGDVTQLPASETVKVNGKVQAKWLTVQDSEAQHFARFADFYSLYTHRSPKCVAKRWGVATSSKISGRISRSVACISKGYFTAMAQATVDLYDAALNACTHASSQGATYDKMHDIAMDYNFVKFADKHMINMLTNRSTVGINFSGSLGKKETLMLQQNKVLANFLAGKVQPITELFKNELAGLTVLTSPLTVTNRQHFQAATPPRL